MPFVGFAFTDTRATPTQVKRALKYLGYAAFDFYYDHINRG